MNDIAPAYVEYSALMTPPAPFQSLRTTLEGFWATADADKLADLCRRVFAEPSRKAVTCTPLGDRVMLTWGKIDAVGPTRSPYDTMGTLREPQVCAWVPVAVHRASGEDRLAMFVPYIWVDNPMSLAAGRELFGYPKSWGWPEFPAQDGPRRWSLDVFGLDYGSGAQAARHRLLDVVEGDGLLDSLDEELDGLATIARHAASRLFDHGGGLPLLDGIELAAHLALDLARGRLAGIFLKQFRNPDGLGAALQQIVEARYDVARVRAAPLLHEHELTVHPLDSHPVHLELGLESQTMEVGYRVEMDFTVGHGHVLWDAATAERVRRAG